MRNLYTLISFALLCSFLSNAQVDFKQIIPPNPNVASLFKSTITPVNEYSGLPSVSIPIYTASEGNISVPISLSYAMGGVQVSEESGIVGLGWALNVGGTITRSVNERDDFDYDYGYLSSQNTTQHPDVPIGASGYFNPDTNTFINGDANCEFPVNTTMTFFNIPTGPTEQTDDLKPDTFHYNFGGHSGSFVFDKNGNAVLMEKEGIKIEFIDLSSNNHLSIIVFEATTPDGTIYEFTERAVTSFPSSNLPSYVSSWFLTAITDIHGNTITLHYANKDNGRNTGTLEMLRSFTQTYEVPTDMGQNAGVNWTGHGNPSLSQYKNTPGPSTSVNDIFLTRIEFDSGDVYFNYSNDGTRKDVKSYSLESLEVINKDNQSIKDISFDYSYFGNDIIYNYNNVSIGNGDFAGIIGALDSKYPHINLRLRLDKVTENGIKVHSFEYFGSDNQIDTPNKTSFSQDYWGFFNKEFNPDSFIPEIRSADGNSLTFPQFIFANRLPNIDYAKYFSLKKISYPTKGSTEFDYELNTYKALGNVNAQPPVTVEKVANASVSDGTASDSDTFAPNPLHTLYIDYDITIRGWNTSMSTSKPNLTTTQMTNNFVLILKDGNGSVIRTKHIPTSEGSTQWTNFTEAQNASGGVAIVYSESESFNNIPSGTYTLEASFNDENGLYYGNANIVARWQDVEVDANKKYSIGGGLRIKSIVDKDNNGLEQSKRNYNYHYALGTETHSYGKLKTLPNYFTSHKVSYFVKNLAESSNAIWQPQSTPVIVGSATSHNSFSKDAGSYVGYDQVEITQEGANGDNGKTIKTFFNLADHFRAYTIIDYSDDNHQFPPIRVPHNGLLQKSEELKRISDGNGGFTYITVSETFKEYEVNGIDANLFFLEDLYQNDDYIVSASKEIPFSHPNTANGQSYDCTEFQIQLYPHYSNIIRETGITEKNYDQDGLNPLSTVQQFFYEIDPIHYQRTGSTITESDGSILDTQMYYPDDITSATSLPEGGTLLTYNLIDQLKADDQHRIAIPVQTVVKKNNTVLSVQRTEFATFNGTILPNKTLVAKGTSLQERLLYEDYIDGKPIQLRKKDGTPISYIWGYNQTYPIAKIENATYSDIATALGITLSALKAYDETNLSNINGLRSSNPEFMITSMTYELLVGMTTITDPKGYTITYEYDGLNRLKEIRDADNKLVSDYQYHYKSQN